MIIADIRVTRLRMPWPGAPPLGTGRTMIHRDLIVVEVETRGGLVGMGYLHILTPTVQTTMLCLNEAIIPRLIGKDATTIEAIWKDLWNATYGAGRMGIIVMAISAIDIALWDLIGKKARMPLHRLWGHMRSEIPIYGSGCYRGLGGDGMIEKAHQLVAEGFKAIKMQVGHLFDRRTDVANVQGMREALGPEIEIMLDVNRGWTTDTAILTGRQMCEYDIYWIEEPVAAEDIAGYMRVADALETRIVGGESNFMRYDMRPFFENPKIPILQPDPMRGGLSEMRKIAAIADTWGMQIAPHVFPELAIQVMASIPNGVWLEHMGWLDDIWVEGPRVADGMAFVPERHGHGLTVKSDIIQEYSLAN
jgi:L-alanine-DL-glutamate epimerase-like enolase superfamily enzyme